MKNSKIKFNRMIVIITILYLGLSVSITATQYNSQGISRDEFSKGEVGAELILKGINAEVSEITTLIKEHLDKIIYIVEDELDLEKKQELAGIITSEEINSFVDFIMVYDFTGNLIEEIKEPKFETNEDLIIMALGKGLTQSSDKRGYFYSSQGREAYYIMGINIDAIMAREKKRLENSGVGGRLSRLQLATLTLTEIKEEEISSGFINKPLDITNLETNVSLSINTEPRIPSNRLLNLTIRPDNRKNKFMSFEEMLTYNMFQLAFISILGFLIFKISKKVASKLN